MRVLVFGGTTEGRELSGLLAGAGIDATLSVATGYGRETAGNNGARVIEGKLDYEGMVDLLKGGRFDCVVDATHPYAAEATLNASSACRAAGVRYIRLARRESAKFPGVEYVGDAGGAAQTLVGSHGNILLTIGSRDLERFTEIENYRNRVFVRILPFAESLSKAVGLGFPGSNIICMQGPFNEEMNVATLRMVNAETLVTKDSGETGGFEAKVRAARALGCRVVVVSRSTEGEGLTFDETLGFFGVGKPEENKSIKNISDCKNKSFFPLFTDVRGKKALIIGGGAVAERRVKTLVPFGADITVISPAVTDSIRLAASDGPIRLIEKKYERGDIKRLAPFMAVAATNDGNANREAAEEAKSLGIPVSVADNAKDCTFRFPAIAENAKTIAGIISKDDDHAGLKRTAAQIREFLNK